MVHKLAHILYKNRGIELPRVLLDLRGNEAILPFLKAPDAIDDRLSGLLAKEDPSVGAARCVINAHGLQRPTVTVRDHRTTIGLRFNRHNSKILISGKQECPAVGIKRR